MELVARMWRGCVDKDTHLKKKKELADVSNAGGRDSCTPLHPEKLAPELKISGHQSQLIGPETQVPE